MHKYQEISIFIQLFHARLVPGIISTLIQSCESFSSLLPFSEDKAKIKIQVTPLLRLINETKSTSMSLKGENSRNLQAEFICLNFEMRNEAAFSLEFGNIHTERVGSHAVSELPRIILTHII